MCCVTRGREGGRERGREGGREGERERGREGGREEGEGGMIIIHILIGMFNSNPMTPL